MADGSQLSGSGQNLSEGLSQDQQAHYWREGYVVLKGLFDAAELAPFNERFEAIVTGSVAPSAAMKIMRDIMVVKGAVSAATPVHAVNKIINFEAEPVLYAYATHAKLLAAVRSLLGPKIYSISTNVFNKPPNVDGRHPFHQDLRYFRIRPADAIIGVWTAMLPAPREAGCLAVVPRSHRGELYEHGDPDWEFVNAGFFAAQGADVQDRVHVAMDPGDTLLFHPLLLHGSGHNTTDNFRRAISAHYASDACESPVREWREGKQVRAIPAC